MIAFCRLVFTPNAFKSSKFGLGAFARPFYVITVLWNCIVFAVSLSMKPTYGLTFQTFVSPFYFPVDSTSFNYSVYVPRPHFNA